jgi:hypothetical protein
MRDYWLSKLFFDLQSPATAAEFRTAREKVLARYALDERVKRAIAENDVPFRSSYLWKIENVCPAFPKNGRGK